MSARIAGWVLFFVAFIAFPLPMFGIEAMFPLARFVQLSIALAALVITEGTQGMVGTFLGLLVAHVVAYSALLGLVVGLFARYVLAPLHHRVRDHVTVILSVLLLSIAAYGELYDTRFHHSSEHAKLLELYR